MRKFAHPIWKLFYLLLALTAFCVVAAIAQEPAQAPKPAEEVYKNIQVLKGMPSPNLMNVMKSFTVSLGVKCDFCHVMGGFVGAHLKTYKFEQMPVGRDGGKRQQSVGVARSAAGSRGTLLRR